MGELTLIGSMPRGRPTTYTKATADEICERLAEGETLKSICADEDMPSRSTVNAWLHVHPEFFRSYARAREIQADHEADEIKEIADKEGVEADQKRIQIDARKWRAERMSAGKWGSKVVHQHHVEETGKLEQDELPGGLSFLGQHKSEEQE